MNITPEELLDIISNTLYVYEKGEKNFKKGISLETGIDAVNKYYANLVRETVQGVRDNQ